MQYFTLNPLMLSCWFCSDYFCYSSGYHFSEIWSHIFHSRVVASNTLPLPLLVLQSHNCLFSRLCMIFGLTSDVSFSLSCKIVIWSFSQLNRYLVSQSVICLSVSQSINGRRIYRGCTPPFVNFFDFWLSSSKRFFCQCYQNYLRHPWLEFFKWVEGGFCGTLPLINHEVFFGQIGHGK